MAHADAKAHPWKAVGKTQDCGAMPLLQARLPISVAIITHQKDVVLAMTLRSILRGGLIELVEQVVVFDSSGQRSTATVCQDIAVPYTCCSIRHSLAEAQNQAAQEFKSQYVLFLEDDSFLLSSLRNTSNVLNESVAVLESGEQIETVRLRHRERPGYPLHTVWFAGKEGDPRASGQLLDSVHWYDDPPSRVPALHHLVVASVNSNWYITSHLHACYTNNPCLYRREWWIENIMPKNYGSAAQNEDNLQAHWKALASFYVAHGSGLFTHWDCHKYPHSTLADNACLANGKSISAYLGETLDGSRSQGSGKEGT